MDNSSRMVEYESTTPLDYWDLEPPVYDDEVLTFHSRFVPALYSLIFVFGLVGNALVVLILIRYKKLRTMTDIYLLNLAISDLLFIFSLPFWAYSVAHEWVFGNAMCKVFSGIYKAGFLSESFFIVLLTIDRYLAIVYPVFAQRARRVVYGILTSILAWFLAFTASVPALFFFHTQKYLETCHCTFYYPPARAKEWKLFSNSVMLLLGQAIPWVILVYCYIPIIKILVKDRNRRKLKAVRLIFVIMIVFSLLWMPYNIALLLMTFKDSCNHAGDCENKFLYIAQVTEIIAMTHCCVNPVIYAFVGEQFRSHLSVLLQKDMVHYLCRPCSRHYRPSLERTTSSFMSTEISTGL